MPSTAPVPFRRGSGVLLHPTSLPGPFGSGDLGQEAVDLIDWLARAGQRYWQTLPLGPTGYGDSPYSSSSAFALSPLLIDPRGLARRGWLPPDSVQGGESTRSIDFAAVKALRFRLLRQAADRFFQSADSANRHSFDSYCSANGRWLDDYSLFSALSDLFNGAEWTSWPNGLAQREPDALSRAQDELQQDIRFHRFTQWACSEQWQALRKRANAAGIEIVGDLPIFVAFQSAEVWANPHLFLLDPSGRPKVIAGVPPDYFSPTGQRWGNPLYRWDVLKKSGYYFWIDRFRATLDQVDIVRVDHFRGFAACWEIPASEPTAVKGRWVPGPGRALFDAARASLGSRLRIIAEDLGVITPDVVALRDGLGFPGMKVLQFAFGSGPSNAFLPHNHVAHSIVYTGTHDNDTTLGWFANVPAGERDYLRRYAATDGRELNWDLIRLGQASVANVAIAPMQDVLGLDSSGRMNTPGLAAGNWGWRFSTGDLTDDLAARMRGLAETYGRLEAETQSKE